MSAVFGFFKEILAGVSFDKSMIIGIVLGFGLKLIPWNRIGQKFDSLMDRIFGVKTSEQLQKKIKEILQDFMKGMDDADVEVNVKVNHKLKPKSAGVSATATQKDSIVIKAKKENGKIIFDE